VCRTLAGVFDAELSNSTPDESTMRVLLLAIALLVAGASRADDAANAEALKVMDAFMAAFNKRDPTS
jgi:hypothetical protein